MSPKKAKIPDPAADIEGDDKAATQAREEARRRAVAASSGGERRSMVGSMLTGNWGSPAQRKTLLGG